MLHTPESPHKSQALRKTAVAALATAAGILPATGTAEASSKPSQSALVRKIERKAAQRANFEHLLRFYKGTVIVHKEPAGPDGTWALPVDSPKGSAIFEGDKAIYHPLVVQQLGHYGLASVDKTGFRVKVNYYEFDPEHMEFISDGDVQGSPNDTRVFRFPINEKGGADIQNPEDRFHRPLFSKFGPEVIGFDLTAPGPKK